MATPFDARISFVLRTGVSPLLRTNGFRKTGRVYLASRQEVTWLVQVEKSRWNSKEKAEFTLSGGIYIPGVVSRYLCKPDPAPTKVDLADCCISTRIGMLDETQCDTWWKFTGSREICDGDRSIALDIQHRLSHDLLPFFIAYDTRRKVIEFLLQPVAPKKSGYMPTASLISPQDEVGRRVYAAFLLANEGNLGQAKQVIERAVTDHRGKPGEEFVKRARDTILGKLVSSTPDLSKTPDPPKPGVND